MARYVEGIADPERPVAADAFASMELSGQAPRLTLGRIGKLAGALLVVIGLTLAWHFTPLSDLVKPAAIEETMTAFATSPWAPLYVMAAYLAGGLVAFPAGRADRCHCSGIRSGPWLCLWPARQSRECRSHLWCWSLARAPAVAKHLRAATQSHSRWHCSKRHSCRRGGAARADRAVHHRQHGGGGMSDPGGRLHCRHGAWAAAGPPADVGTGLPDFPLHRCSQLAPISFCLPAPLSFGSLSWLLHKDLR